MADVLFARNFYGFRALMYSILNTVGKAVGSLGRLDLPACQSLPNSSLTHVFPVFLTYILSLESLTRTLPPSFRSTHR